MEDSSPLPIRSDLPPANDGFLGCGLGSLGQNCVANLKSFGVPMHTINSATAMGLCQRRYQHQALRLTRLLTRAQVKAQVLQVPLAQ